VPVESVYGFAKSIIGHLNSATASKTPKMPSQRIRSAPWRAPLVRSSRRKQSSSAAYMRFVMQNDIQQ
jgi:hypothetical protein